MHYKSVILQQMKKYFLILLTVVFSLIFVATAGFSVLAQFPSFELYSSTCGAGKNCTPWPLVENINATKFGNFIVISAHIYDVSGVSSAVASIEGPDDPGEYVMYDDGYHYDGGENNGIYGAIIDISDWDADATYYVNISATDNLLNNGQYVHAKSFVISSINGECATVNNATICMQVPPPPSNQISSFTVNPTSAAIGDTVVLVANLSEASAGEVISFTDNTTGYHIGNVATDSSGIATINYSVYGTIFGSRALSAIYNGNPSMGLFSDYEIRTLNVTTTGDCAAAGNAVICINTSASTSPP